MLEPLDVMKVQEILAAAKRQKRRVTGRRTDGSVFTGIPDYAEGDGSWWLIAGREDPLVQINNEEVAEIR